MYKWPVGRAGWIGAGLGLTHAIFLAVTHRSSGNIVTILSEALFAVALAMGVAMVRNRLKSAR